MRKNNTMKNARKIFLVLPLLLLFSSSLAQADGLITKKEQPDASTQQAQSWRALVWKAQKDQLTVTNTGKSPVHLGRDVKLMPDEMPLTLLKTTLQPGETLQVYGACPEHLLLQKEVIITLDTARGQQNQLHMLPINH